MIAAIGPLNSRKEANAHSHDGMDVTVEDIRINFSSTVSKNVTYFGFKNTYIFYLLLNKIE